MRKRKENVNFLKVNNDERSSLFVVDLKETEIVEEEVKKSISKVDWKKAWGKVSEINLKEKINNFSDSILIFKNKIVKTFNFAKKLKNIKKETILRQIKKIAIPKSTEAKIVEKKQDKFQVFLKKFDDFAFLYLFKLLILFVIKFSNIVYKISYKIGLYLIYSIRFIASLFPIKFWKSQTIRKQVLIERSVHEVEDKVQKNIISSSTRKESFKENIKFIFEFFKVNTNFERKKLGDKIADKSVYVEASVDKGKRFEFLSSDMEGPIMDISLRKSVLKFALILFIIILPFKILSYKSLSFADLKGRVLGASEQAIDSLEQASGSASIMDFEGASVNFAEASNNFLKAQDEIGEINDIFFALLKIIPNEEARFASEGKNILEGGRVASELGNNLSLAIETIFDSKDKNLIEIIDEFVYHGEKALDDINRLNQIIGEINIDNLPVEYREQFVGIKDKSIVIEKGLTEFIELGNEIKVFLGDTYDKRYLLVFQNNTEMRATGGFIGSYALVDFSNGKLKNLEVPGGGSYDTEGGLSVLVQAPKPLHLVNSLWHFWDVNWWPDWTKSAKKLMWFYEKSDGSTVDGVISFTPTVLEDLLDIIGPIDMTEEYGVVLDSENFWLTVQNVVENKDTIYQSDIDGNIIENNIPKKLIGDLMEKIIEELPKRLDKEKFVKLFSALESNLSEKHVLFYFNNEKLQSEIESHGWDGGLKDFKWDFLSVINTNIAGGKSDKVIEESISLQTDVSEDGSIINTLKIKRTHTGIKHEVFTGVRNVDWLRVYVPTGSELIETSGFTKPNEVYFDEVDSTWIYDDDLHEEESNMEEFGEDKTNVYDESGKTVFANWSMVDPGKTTEIIIRYKLPFIIEKKEVDDGWVGLLEKMVNPGKKKLIPYAVYFQKQSGSIGSGIDYSLSLPENLELTISYPQKIYLSKNNFKYSSVLETDKYSAFLIEEK